MQYIIIVVRQDFSNVKISLCAFQSGIWQLAVTFDLTSYKHAPKHQALTKMLLNPFPIHFPE